MAKIASVTGVVLAGGLSRRMGGGDKGLLDIGGTTMLGRVVSRLRPQVGQVVLNANGDPRRFADLGLPVVADTVGDFAGPLAGILAGMRWSLKFAPQTSYIATVSSDVPFLPGDLVERLVAATADRPTVIAIAQCRDTLHQVIGLWPVSLASDLEQQLTDGSRKVLDWSGRHAWVPVAFDPVTIGGHVVDPFFNANTPAELDFVRRVLAEASQ